MAISTPAGAASNGPCYVRPPVVEVALGAQFKPLESLGVPQLGLLWEKFSGRFPKVEHQPPLAHEVERRGVQQQQPIFRVLEPAAVLVPRLWMVSESASELVQIQQDRFIRNWRRYHDGKVVYPEYAKFLRPRMIEDLTAFLDFARAANLGNVEFDQCDVTYVNHIEPNEGWDGSAAPSKVFPDFAPENWAKGSSPLDGLGFRVRHELLDARGEFAGHLYIQLDLGLTVPTQESPEPHSLLVLQLYARGAPMGKGVEGVLGFLDLGHDAIVTTFDMMTSPAMHKAWGKKA